jgi:hypothetical protein
MSLINRSQLVDLPYGVGHSLMVNTGQILPSETVELRQWIRRLSPNRAEPQQYPISVLVLQIQPYAE